jgi:hypothetical protein
MRSPSPSQSGTRSVVVYFLLSTFYFLARPLGGLDFSRGITAPHIA